MEKTKEISFGITSKNIERLVDILKDLSGIDKKAIFKINKNTILIYTLVGENNAVNAFKSFIVDTKDMFEMDDFDENINFISKDIKNMYRNLQIMIDQNTEITGKIYFDSISDQYYSDRFFFKSENKLKLNFYGSDPLSMNTTITPDIIKKTADVKNSYFNFELLSSDFDNIKKLATPDTETDVFYMNTYDKDGKYYVSLGESSWDLTMSEIDFDQNKTLAFPKKYFKTISMIGDKIKIYVFDRFLMASNENSDLLISTEVTV
jgi:hypothetical protein